MTATSVRCKWWVPFRAFGVPDARIGCIVTSPAVRPGEVMNRGSGPCAMMGTNRGNWVQSLRPLPLLSGQGLYPQGVDCGGNP